MVLYTLMQLLGLGGYTKEILKKSNCTVLGIDRDPDVEKFTVILKKYKSRFKFYSVKFW